MAAGGSAGFFRRVPQARRSMMLSIRNLLVRAVFSDTSWQVVRSGQLRSDRESLKRESFSQRRSHVVPIVFDAVLTMLLLQ